MTTQKPITDSPLEGYSAFQILQTFTVSALLSVTEKCGALVLNTLDTDVSTHCLDDGFYNVQANTTARDLGDRDIFCPIKSLEEMRHCFSGDTGSVVGY